MRSPSERDSITLSTATEADLDALVKIQFAAFAPDAHQQGIGEVDTPANRAVAAARHAADMQANPGLVIVKAALHPDGPLAGFCMFYFPNQDVATAAERVPTPLRPQPAVAEAAVDGARPDLGGGGEAAEADREAEESRCGRQAETQALGEAKGRFLRQEIRNHVKDRECAYIRYMSVEPAYQRQGVGKALMAWACARLDKLGVDAYLQASTSGEGLYRQFGFDAIGHSAKNFGAGLHIEYLHMWRNARKHDEPLV